MTPVSSSDIKPINSGRNPVDSGRIREGSSERGAAARGVDGGTRVNALWTKLSVLRKLDWINRSTMLLMSSFNEDMMRSMLREGGISHESGERDGKEETKAANGTAATNGEVVIGMKRIGFPSRLERISICAVAMATILLSPTPVLIAEATQIDGSIAEEAAVEQIIGILGVDSSLEKPAIVNLEILAFGSIASYNEKVRIWLLRCLSGGSDDSPARLMVSPHNTYSLLSSVNHITLSYSPLLEVLPSI